MKFIPFPLWSLGDLVPARGQRSCLFSYTSKLCNKKPAVLSFVYMSVVTEHRTLVLFSSWYLGSGRTPENETITTARRRDPGPDHFRLLKQSFSQTINLFLYHTSLTLNSDNILQLLQVLVTHPALFITWLFLQLREANSLFKTCLPLRSFEDLTKYHITSHQRRCVL